MVSPPPLAGHLVQHTELTNLVLDRRKGVLFLTIFWQAKEYIANSCLTYLLSQDRRRLQTTASRATVSRPPLRRRLKTAASLRLQTAASPPSSDRNLAAVSRPQPLRLLQNATPPSSQDRHLAAVSRPPPRRRLQTVASPPPHRYRHNIVPNSRRMCCKHYPALKRSFMCRINVFDYLSRQKPHHSS